MLFLLFQLGTERYALQAADIVEVLPLVGVREVAGGNVSVVGLFNYRGTAVPLIDLTRLLVGRQAQHRLSTRIVLVRYAAGDGVDRLVGLIAERATQTARLDSGSFTHTPLGAGDAPLPGPVANEGAGFIQKIDLRTLLADFIGGASLADAMEAG